MSLGFSFKSFGRKAQSRNERVWRDILSRWAEAHEAYIAANRSDDADERDLGWWYKERAAVGFLSAAVWKAGGVALEEYSTHKRRGGRNPGLKTRREKVAVDRGDLVFSHRGQLFACEAKSALLYAVSARVFPVEKPGLIKVAAATAFWDKRIKALISKARRDALQIPTGKHVVAAVVFVAPMVRLPGIPAKVRVAPGDVESVADQFRQTIDAVAKACASEPELPPVWWTGDYAQPPRVAQRSSCSIGLR